MILSASRRSDIPAHYAPWLMGRLREGFLCVRNPFNHAQQRRIGLSPAEIDCIVFWSKDPAPLLPHLSEIDRLGHRYYFQFTLNPYGPELEPGLRPLEERLACFVRLSQGLGAARVLWRYDPIIVYEGLPVAEHLRRFAALCGRLAGHTPFVTISFLDLYARLRSPLLRACTKGEVTELAAGFAEIAAGHGLQVRACCESAELRALGIAQASCIDRETIETICGRPIGARPDKNQRAGCGCMSSVDIGAYNSCPSGCVYCYAAQSQRAAERNRLRHDPASPFLLD
ncbi:MAG: DUF1848 domain-containing protein [Christensenellaceae bacterium]|jgi:hypothetical protein|nr:DUF1848 domain-containing protein [Christensenellaceae bacterium]